MFDDSYQMNYATVAVRGVNKVEIESKRNVHDQEDLSMPS